MELVGLWELLHSRHCRLPTMTMEVDSHTVDTVRRPCTVECRPGTRPLRLLGTRLLRRSQSLHLDIHPHHLSKVLVDSELPRPHIHLLPLNTRLPLHNSLLPRQHSRQRRQATRLPRRLMLDRVVVDHNTRPHHLLIHPRVPSQVRLHPGTVLPVPLSARLVRGTVLPVQHSVLLLPPTRRLHRLHSRRRRQSTRTSPFTFVDIS